MRQVTQRDAAETPFLAGQSLPDGPSPGTAEPNEGLQHPRDKFAAGLVRPEFGMSLGWSCSTPARAGCSRASKAQPKAVSKKKMGFSGVLPMSSKEELSLGMPHAPQLVTGFRRPRPRGLAKVLLRTWLE